MNYFPLKNDYWSLLLSIIRCPVVQAKGLEWDVVFVVRFNEEEFPLTARPDDAEYLVSSSSSSSSSKQRGGSEQQQEWFERVFGEEERRLAYVALSRAKEELCVSYITDTDGSGGSGAGGGHGAANGGNAPPPSRFLRDVPTATCRRFQERLPA